MEDPKLGHLNFKLKSLREGIKRIGKSVVSFNTGLYLHFFHFFIPSQILDKKESEVPEI